MGLFDFHPSASEETIEELTRQFAITLRAYFARVARPPSKDNEWAFAKVSKILELADPSWEQCYEVEQLLVYLFDDVTLRAELEARRLEARNLVPVVASHYEREIDAAKDSARRRALLARLVNDLQWRYTINEGKRHFGKSLAWRTGSVSVAVLLAFSSLVAVVRWCSNWWPTYDDASLFFVASAAGAWGATFSMLTTMTSRIEASAIYDLKVTRQFVMIVARLLIGVAAAALLFFFLVSGLLGGAAFPTLSKPETAATTPPAAALAPTPDPTPAAAADAAPAAPAAACPWCSQETGAERLPMKQLALLIVWCFIAGFSEQLVPAILAKTERGSDVTPERIRPVDGNGPAANGRTRQRDAENADEDVPEPEGDKP